MSFLSLFVLIQLAMLSLSQASTIALNETGIMPFARQSASPPFSGSIFLDPDIITGRDPTTFMNLVYIGRGNRVVYDRRFDRWLQINAFVFHATFNDYLTFEVRVNPEFGSTTAAYAQARKYSIEIGRIPTVLRVGVKYVVIHKGLERFGGGRGHLLIHTDQGDRYISQGILEETLVHEAAHSSLDPYHASDSRWIVAQKADPTFITTYARDYPSREDIAESFLLYIAVRYRRNRISNILYDTVLRTMPNRIAYFFAQKFKMYPIA